MCSDLSRRGPVGVEQTGGGAMRRVALVAAQRCLDCVADNRVNEARRVVGCQHLEPNEAGGQTRGVRHLHAGDRRRVAQLAAVPEHGERLRKAQRARIKATNAGQHPPRDPLTPANQKLVRLELGQPPTVELDRPQQLGHIQGIAAGRRPHRRAQPIARPVANRVADDRARRRPRSKAPAAATASACARSARDEAARRRRARRAAARRGALSASPSNRDDRYANHRSDGSSAHCASSTAISSGRRSARLAASQYRPCKTANDVSSAAGPRSSPNSNGRAAPAGPASNASRSSGVGARQAPLKQLAHHAEREVRLERRTTRQQDFVPEPRRPATRRLNQRRLPDTHTTLDHEDPAAALQQLRYSRQLPLALEQLLHGLTLRAP